MDLTQATESVLSRCRNTPDVTAITENAVNGAQRLAALTAPWRGSKLTPSALSEALNALQGLRVSILALESQSRHTPQSAG